jgi:hypothetical protein
MYVWIRKHYEKVICLVVGIALRVSVIVILVLLHRLGEERRFFEEIDRMQYCSETSTVPDEDFARIDDAGRILSDPLQMDTSSRLGQRIRGEGTLKYDDQAEHTADTER